MYQQKSYHIPITTLEDDNIQGTFIFSIYPRYSHDTIPSDTILFREKNWIRAKCYSKRDPNEYLFEVFSEDNTSLGLHWMVPYSIILQKAVNLFCLESISYLPNFDLFTNDFPKVMPFTLTDDTSLSQDIVDEANLILDNIICNGISKSQSIISSVALLSHLNENFISYGPIIIICTEDQLRIWEELLTFYSEQKLLVYAGSKQTRNLLLDPVLQDDSGYFHFHVLLTTQLFFFSDFTRLNSIKWRLSITSTTNSRINCIEHIYQKY